MELAFWVRAEVTRELAVLRFERGEIDAAEALARAAVNPAGGAADDVVLAGLKSRRLLSRIALWRGHLDEARSELRAAFRQAMAIEDAGGLTEIADTAAKLAAATGDQATAARLLAWSDHMRYQLEVARDPHDQKHAAALRAELPPPEAEPITEMPDTLGEYLD